MTKVKESPPLLLPLIETRLQELIPLKDSSFQKLLYEASHHTLFSPGKRWRPLITLSLTEDGGKPIESALDPACAIEMIHTYSLIHDDLPCMDDDSFRRGKPTLHKVYGEGIAVLTGDFLLTKAFEVLANAPFLSAEKKLDCIATLSKAAGDEGMVGGQVVDLLSEKEEITSLSVDWMNVAKTGALFRAAFEFGAILGDYEEQERTILSYAALLFGLAYQMVDDLADGNKDSKKKGSSLLIYGEKGTKQRAKQLLDEGLRQLDQVKRPLENLKSLLSAIPLQPILSRDH